MASQTMNPGMAPTDVYGGGELLLSKQQATN